ncbi:MAG TPA: hypothetical protein VF630_16230 [Hymenobacter sp.]|jgi:hypothetical protein
MAILNYTTKIAPSKTVGEIQGILAKAGCRKIVTDYDEQGEPSALTFMVPMQERPVYFALPCNREGVLKAMTRDRKVPRSACTPAQAQRVAWRIIKDWCEAQLAIIEAGQAQLAEVFLPYAVTADGHTLFKAIDSGTGTLQLSR